MHIGVWHFYFNRIVKKFLVIQLSFAIPRQGVGVEVSDNFS